MVVVLDHPGHQGGRNRHVDEQEGQNSNGGHFVSFSRLIISSVIFASYKKKKNLCREKRRSRVQFLYTTSAFVPSSVDVDVLRTDDRVERLRRPDVVLLVGHDEQDPDDVSSDDDQRVAADLVRVSLLRVTSFDQPFQLVDVVVVFVGTRFGHVHVVQHSLNGILERC